MSEHAISEVAELAVAVSGISSMVRTRARRLYREADELRKLSAQLDAAAELLKHDAASAAADTLEGIRNA